MTGRYGVAQVLEGGTHQGGCAVAFVDEAPVGRRTHAVLGEAGLRGRDLAPDVAWPACWSDDTRA